MLRPLARPTFSALLIVLCAAILGARPIIAQLEASCPALVVQALEEADNACAGLGRNAACYGYNQVAATFNQSVAPAFFSVPADRGELTLFESIRTSVLDTLRQRWGIAFLNVQAMVPDSLPGQGVIFVLMGDTTIENEVAPDAAFKPAAPVEATAQVATALRSLPLMNANARAEIAPGDRLLADGLSEDGAWLRVVKDDVAGWVERDSVTSAADLDALPTLSDDLRTPMQAFRFRTGIGRIACEQAPDVLVVQGPHNLNVNLSANGANIVLGSTIVLRTLSEVDLPTVLPDHASAADTVAFSADDVQVATGDTAGVIRLWTQASGALQHTLASQGSAVVGLAFLRAGGLISAEADGALRWWDATSGTQTRVIETGGSITDFALSEAAGIVATGGGDAVRLWRADTGEAAGDIPLAGASPTALVFSPDGRWLAVGGSDGSIHLWDVAAEAVVQAWNAQTGAVRALTFDPLGQALAVGGDDDETRLWNLPAGDLRLTLPTGPADALAWSPNGYTLAVGGAGAHVDLWDMGSGGRQATLVGHQGAIDRLTYSSDGLVLASGAADTTARLWRLAPRRMEVITLDGNVVVDGVPVPVGYSSTAPLGPDGLVVGAWSPATPVPIEELRSLTLLTELTDEVLNYPITLPLGGPVAFALTSTPEPASAPTQPPPTTGGSGGDGNAPTSTPTTMPGCGITATVGDDESFTGSDCDDVLEGSDGANTIMGVGGNDLINGNGGDDLLDGGDGADTLRGGTGDDELHGGADHDLLDSGAGNDTLIGGPGSDTLYGGAGDDLLFDDEGYMPEFALTEQPPMEAAGDDLLEGGDGNDTLFSTGGNDTLRGGTGDDELYSGEGDDLLEGGDGNDTLYDYAGNNTLDGGAGDDVIEGGYGDDLLIGGAGNDTIWDGYGADTVQGGDGHDEIYLTGDEDADHVDAGVGDDTIYFGSQAAGDVVTGGTGSNLFVFNWIIGHLTVESQGDDTLDFSDYGAPVTVDTSVQDEPQEVAPDFWLTLRGIFQVVFSPPDSYPLTATVAETASLAPDEPDDGTGTPDDGQESTPEASTPPAPQATDVVVSPVETTPEPVSNPPEATPEVPPAGEMTPDPVLPPATGDDTQTAPDAGSLPDATASAPPPIDGGSMESPPDDSAAPAPEAAGDSTDVPAQDTPPPEPEVTAAP